MKNMSFGKLMGIFGAFFLVILIGAVLAMKMSAKKGAASVVTKTYAPAETQSAPAAPAPEQPATQAPAQAALQGSPAAAAGATLPVPAQAAPLGTQALYDSPAPQDMGQRLASIDSQLASIQSRLAAVEGKRSASGNANTGTPSSASLPTRPAKRVRRAQPSKAVDFAQVNEPRGAAKSSEVKALAVVGNRAWVRGSDGLEESVTTGDAMPMPRPRVRSVDASNGVVIMSSDMD
jgi:hypothetical protein